MNESVPFKIVLQLRELCEVIYLYKTIIMTKRSDCGSHISVPHFIIKVRLLSHSSGIIKHTYLFFEAISLSCNQTIL